MNDIVLEATVVNIEPQTEVFVDAVSDAKAVALDALVRVENNEYVLSSGGMYGGGSLVGSIPAWVLEAVNQRLTTGDGNLTSLVNDLQTAMDALQTGVTQSISNLESDVLSQSGLITSLRSDLDKGNASIMNALATKVTPTEASALAVQAIESKFGPDASAFIANIASTYVDANSAIATEIDILQATLNGVSASVSDISSITIETVENPEWVNDGNGTDPDINGNPRYIEQAIAQKQLEVNSNGIITGLLLESGETSSITMQADQFKLIASGQTAASKNPFSVNATTGDITFNGKVSFNSISDSYTYITSPITAAQASANAAQANAASALSQLTDIASDNILSPVEKSTVIADYTVIIDEKSGIDAQATNYGITTEKTAYDTAVSELTAYLNTLRTPVTWSVTTGNTTIVGATFRSKFQNVYTTRQTLLNKILSSAKEIADSKLSSDADLAALINSNTTTINGGKITTGTITAGQIAANTITTSNLTTGITLVNGKVSSSDFTTIGGPGFRLKSNAAGTSADPTMYGAYVKGGVLEANRFVSAMFDIGNNMCVNYAINPNNTAPFAVNKVVYSTFHAGNYPEQTTTGSTTIYSASYGSGYMSDRLLSNSLARHIIVSGVMGEVAAVVEESVDGGDWNILSQYRSGTLALMSFTNFTSSCSYRVSGSTNGSTYTISIRVYASNIN